MSWRRAAIAGGIGGLVATSIALVATSSADQPPLWAFVLLLPGQFLPMLVNDLTGIDSAASSILLILGCQSLLWGLGAVVILRICRSFGLFRRT